MGALNRFFLALTFFSLGLAILSASPILAGLQCLAAALFFGADLIQEAATAAWKRLRGRQ